MRTNIKSGFACGIILFTALSGAITTAFSENELQWTGGVSGKLVRGETLTYKRYLIEVTAFPAPVESSKYKPEPEEPVTPFVGLNISKNGKFISTFGLGLAESYIVPDGAILVSGKTTSEGVLEPGMNMSFNYTLKTDAKKSIKLPPATAEYYEYGSKGRKISVNSLNLK